MLYAFKIFVSLLSGHASYVWVPQELQFLKQLTLSTWMNLSCYWFSYEQQCYSHYWAVRHKKVSRHHTLWFRDTNVVVVTAGKLWTTLSSLRLDMTDH